MTQCKAVTDPDSVWSFCPAIAPAYLYAVLFAFITIAHVTQAVIYRKFYSFVIILSSAIQTAAYVLRILSIKNVTSSGLYTYWFVFIMACQDAPIFTNAYVYMVQGRMVYNFTSSARIFKIPAWRFGMTFVLLDVIAFCIQAAGAVIASGSDTDTQMDRIMTGLHIYMGGIAFQQLCIFGFMAIAIRFHLDLRKQTASPGRQMAFTLLYVQYAALLLITIRIIFRLIEYSGGLNSAIPNHEAYQYIFDSTLMMIALVLYNIWHPGRMMPGKESDLPGRRHRKALKKQGLVAQGRVAEEPLVAQKSLQEVPSDSDIELGNGLSYPVGWNRIQQCTL